MKKVFLLFICLTFLYIPVYADDSPADGSNWGIQTNQHYSKTSPSQKVWDTQRDQIIDEKFGSDTSPAFLNRENIDPRDSDFEDNYDYEDDGTYDYDAGGS